MLYATAWSKTAAVLARRSPEQPQQQAQPDRHQQAVVSEEGLHDAQEQVLQQCHGQQQLTHLPGYQLSEHHRRCDAHTSSGQQQLQLRCGADTSQSEAGTLVLVQQQEDHWQVDGEEPQLFAHARMMEEDLQAYAVLVHELKVKSPVCSR